MRLKRKLFHRVELKRRMIPPVASVLIGLAAFSPLITEWPNEVDTNQATLFAITGMFLLKAGLFYWMRTRMEDGVRQLTLFGQSLVDFFTAITLCDLAIATLFGAGYVSARMGHAITPFWVRVTDRAILVSCAALVMLTGAAVAIEMRKAGLQLRVHEDIQ